MRARLILCGTIAIGACADGVEAPEPLGDCEAPVLVHDATELSAALAAAGAGTCILLRDGNYPGSFVVPGGVSLGGVRGERAVIVGQGDTVNGLDISAPDAAIANLTIAGSTRVGIRVSAAPVFMFGLDIAGSRRAAVEIRCEEQGCLMPTARVELADVAVSDNDTGFIIAGARAHVERGSSVNADSESLTGGAGAYVLDGADVTFVGTRFTHNAYGLVIDGATTHVRLEDTTVEHSGDGGIWAQGLRGTLTSPALEIAGGASSIRQNGLTGLGAIDARGITVTGGEISETVLKNVPIDVNMNNADIGDGIGLFAGSSEVAVASVTLRDNARAQAVIDTPGAGIVFGANQVSGGIHKVVVQNEGASNVTIPPADVSSVAMPLPIRSNRIAVPNP